MPLQARAEAGWHCFPSSHQPEFFSKSVDRIRFTLKVAGGESTV